VGKWVSQPDEAGIICEAQFKTKNRLYIREERHLVEGEGQEMKYFHYYRKYNGTYSITNDRVALHYSDITDQLVTYKSGQRDMEDRQTNLPVYDELVNYEVDEHRNNLTLIRYSGTDSTRTQVFIKQKFK
jgi:hypothetical protein